MMHDDEVGSQLVIFELFNEIWISFRGTQIRDMKALAKDLLIDFNMKQTVTTYLQHDTCLVHAGFDRSKFMIPI